MKVDASEMDRLESALTGLKEQESRLVHLYTLGELYCRRVSGRESANTNWLEKKRGHQQAVG